MKIKRLMALLVATAMTVGMIPSLVFAREIDNEPEEQEIAESSEPEKEEETKPQVKETTKPKAEEPEETKGEEPAESKDEEPEETKGEEPSETKGEEPEETKGEEPAESKGGEPEETQGEEPSESQGEEPSETQGEEPSESGEETAPEEQRIPEDVLNGIEAKLPAKRYTGTRSTDNDTLFNRYVESKISLGGTSAKRNAALAGQRFTGAYKVMYDQLKPAIAKTANGSVASAKYHIDMDVSGAVVSSWTAQQLGVSAVVAQNPSTGEYYITDEAMDALSVKTNIYPVINALLVDCPYELYWYDKEKGVQIFETLIGVRTINNVNALYFKNGINVAFYVADEYAVDTFKINTSKINRVNTAINNAKSIVTNAANKSDYDKLVTYSKAICDRVEYDDDAAEDPTIPYGDPWQLISVFDGDPKTNVVCEGYSKAFKYLCDLTSFSKPIECIIVNGTTIYYGESGRHMWNVVKMENGKNYLVDVTNCDTGNCGYPDKLFLAGYLSGNVSSGYTFRCGYSSVLQYIYSDATKINFPKDLVIANANYVPTGVSGTIGNNLTWSITGNTLTISGTGSMPDFTVDKVAPWDNYSKFITNIVISDGITTIGDNSFFLFTGVKNIKLPSTVTKIGTYAFGGCTSLTGIKIPNAVKSIGDFAFYGCQSLTRVTIEEGLHKSCPANAFELCSKVQFVDYLVAGDYELQITNPATNGTGTVTFIGMAKAAEAVSIPAVAAVNGINYKVTRIGPDAFFQDNTIKTAVIGANVVIIDGNAFYGCPNLVKVSGGAKLKTIGANAFARCPKLSSFVITSKVLSKIGAQSFYGDSKLKTLYIKKTTKLTKSGLKNSLKGSSVKTVKVKKSKVRKYKKYFKKSNSGRKVKVKK